jgi:hypothetical protein
VAICRAQTVSIPREHHAWGRFEPGSWVQIRKLTEEMDDQGNAKCLSTTESKTTLTKVAQVDCTVQLEVTVVVARKRFAGHPRVLQLGFNGETNGRRAEVKKVGTDSIQVGTESVPCHLLEATVDGESAKQVSTIHYSPSVAPYILRRETRTIDAEGNASPYVTTVDTIAAGMPYQVQGVLRTVSFVRTVENRAKGSTYTLEVYCPDIPGGVVAHTSKELDETGRVIRRTTLELIAYGIGFRRTTTTRHLFFPHRHSTYRIP